MQNTKKSNNAIEGTGFTLTLDSPFSPKLVGFMVNPTIADLLFAVGSAGHQRALALIAGAVSDEVLESGVTDSLQA